MKRLALIVAVLAAMAVGLQATPAQAAPESSANCTPQFAPVVCLLISGTGLHVNSFTVQAFFGHEVDSGTVLKGYWRVCNGPCSLSNPNVYVYRSALKTYNVLTGVRYEWTFTVNKTYANPWTACGQFYDTNLTPYQFRTYRPCGDITP